MWNSLRLRIAALRQLRRPQPVAEYRPRSPLVPLVPALGILVCAYMMVKLPSDTWIRLVVWLVIGFLIYFLYGRTHSRVGRGLDGHAPAMGD